MVKKRILVRLMIWNFVFTMILSSLGTDLVNAQERCETELEQAKQQYFFGRFERAIELTSKCIEQSNPNKEQLMNAYRLLALSYMAIDLITQAKEAITKLLKLEPHYQPDPDQDPPTYARIVEEVKEEITSIPEPIVAPVTEQKGGGKKWLFIGGGVVTAGVVTAFLLRGGGNGNGGLVPGPLLLPAPPDDPRR